MTNESLLQKQLWRRFSAQADAELYCDAQTTLMGLPPNGVTQRWAVPMLLTDGSYVVPEYVHTTGVEWQANWTLPAVPD